MSLSEWIIEKIKKEGPLSFRDFMELCLYHPQWGYYTADGDRIGPSGDFYTSPCFTSLFGEMLARQLEEMWLVLGKKEFTIVEYGAGTGILCRDILRALEKNGPLYEGLRYYIIEKSPAMREKERACLRSAEQTPADSLLRKIDWVDSIHDIAPIAGCILSNELIDNFSVHRVVMEDELMEILVDYEEGHGFRELLRPAPGGLKDYMEELGIGLPRGFRTEINLQALEWLKEIATALIKGWLLTIDYGYPSAELYSAKRNTGTLTCYHRHQTHHCPYLHIGGQDITAHVNFSALRHWGSSYGLEYGGFTNQSFFLRGMGIVHHIRNMENSRMASTYKDLPGEGAEQFLRTLLLDMGGKFKMLLQSKNTPFYPLSGFRFPQPLEGSRRLVQELHR